MSIYRIVILYYRGKLQMDDRRITNQSKYLKGAVLQRLLLSLRITKTDLDHCEFCMGRFSDNQADLLVGYCTLDYYWICMSSTRNSMNYSIAG